MKKKRKGNKFIKAVLIVIVISVIGLAGWDFYSDHRGSEKADTVMSVLQEIVPGMGDDGAVSTGVGRDPLAAVSIEGVDIVGALEIPALNIQAPVTSKDYSEEFFASWLDGSPAKGNFKIIGGRDDLFRRLAKLKPGDRVAFTDIDGVRYRYEVTTQYHLKKWDEGENELQLCYETTDGDTYFVVGCGAVQ